METRIQKWGNSLGVRIPKSFAEEADVEAGSTVDISVVNGEFVVRPLRRPPYRLDDLLEEITARNVHAEIDIGRPRGREAW